MTLLLYIRFCFVDTEEEIKKNRDMFPLKDTIPHRQTPFVMWLIFVVNTLVFLFQLSLSREALQELILRYGVIPRSFTDPRWAWENGLKAFNVLSFLTSMFLHGGWFHFISNMWAFLIFADNVEDRLGHLRFLAFYLLCGLFAGLIHVLFNPFSPVPTIGASGAISGVMGAYMVLFPTSRIITLVPIFLIPFLVEIPAFLFIGLWFLSQFFNGMFSLLLPQNFGGIAWWAHIGGFVFGILLLPIFLRRSRGYRRRFS